MSKTQAAALQAFIAGYFFARLIDGATFLRVAGFLVAAVLALAYLTPTRGRR